MCAMLRAEMQRTTYLPVCCSTRDPNVGASSSTWPLTEYQTWKIASGYSIPYPLYMGNEKEMLKQIMLRHERIFMNQVHELHRLYNRQKELMGEMKIRMLTQLQEQPDNYSSLVKSGSAMKCDIPSLPRVNPIPDGPTVLGPQNLQDPFKFVAEPCPDSTVTEAKARQSESFLLESKKPKKWVLDLELPGEVYVDIEEEERFEKENVSEMVCPPPAMDLFPRKGCFDLNAPVEVEEAKSPMSMNVLEDRHVELPSINLGADKCLNGPVQVEEAKSPMSSNVFEERHIELSSIDPGAGRSGSSCTLLHDSSNDVEFQAQLPNLNISLVDDETDTEATEQTNLSFGLSDKNSELTFEDEHIKYDEETDLLGIGSTSDLSLTCSEDVTVMDEGDGNKLSGFRILIDLNSCITEEEPMLMSSAPSAVMVTETDVEAPVSPENKEESPPRGESEEDHLVTNVEAPVSPENNEESPPRGESEEYHLQTNVEFSNHELDRLAAEAILSISSSVVQTQEPLETSYGSLHLFAEVVSSTTGDFHGKIELLPYEIDEFEELTLKLKERDPHEYLSYICKEDAAFSLSSPTQHTTPRSRRVRKLKDFQTEVLPCLVSLSRNEAKEDLQVFAAMLEGANPQVEKVAKKRNKGERKCGKRKRRVSPSPTMISPSKQQSEDKELGFIGGWGKTNKGRRGRRVPASDLSYLVFR